MVRFIDDYRTVYGVGPICNVLPIAPSTYYAIKAKQADSSKRSARAQRDAERCEAIEQLWDDSHQVYGARKVWCQLRRDGWNLARCAVERLMRELGLQGVVRGHKPRTTHSDPTQDSPRPIMSSETLPRMRQTRFGWRILPTVRLDKALSIPRL